MLLLQKHRPENASFYHRIDGTKDKSNGLIGQAWTIEALIEGYLAFKNEKYLALAKKVFLLHKFDEKTGYWKKKEINGKDLFYDLTFNHQLWFAAIGSKIPDKEVQRRVKQFMSKLEKNIGIHKSGLIKHFIFSRIMRKIFLLKNFGGQKELEIKEQGYHAFNLYAFAMLHQAYPAHSFWKSTKFKKILCFSLSEEQKNSAYGNRIRLFVQSSRN